MYLHLHVRRRNEPVVSADFVIILTSSVIFTKELQFKFYVQVLDEVLQYKSLVNAVQVSFWIHAQLQENCFHIQDGKEEFERAGFDGIGFDDETETTVLPATVLPTTVLPTTVLPTTVLPTTEPESSGGLPLATQIIIGTTVGGILVAAILVIIIVW